MEPARALSSADDVLPAAGRSVNGVVAMGEVGKGVRRRSRAHLGARPATIGPRVMKSEVARGRLLANHGYRRPLTRAECAAAERPCPFVSCRHHLCLEVNPANGAIKINFPGVELSEMLETCALDVADRGVGKTLEEIGALLNVTRERARQLEQLALIKLQRKVEIQRMREHLEGK